MSGDNHEDKKMSASKKDKSEAIDNAAEVIERFGGIRPMAKKIDVAVTTIQGWKKRDTIPAGRRAQILEAAQEHKVDLSGVISDASVDVNDDPANENSQKTKTESVKPATPIVTVSTAPIVSAPSKTDSKGDEEPLVLSEKAADKSAARASVPSSSDNELSALPRTLEKKLEETEKKAVTKSTWINFALLVLGLIAIGVLLLSGNKGTQDNQQRLGALEEDVGQLRGDVNAVKENQSFLSTLVPKDLDERIQRIQDQATEAQQKVNQAIATARVVGSDVSGALDEGIVKLQEQAATITSSTQIQGLLSQFQNMSQTDAGQGQLDRAMSELNKAMASFNGNTQNMDQFLESARASAPALNETFADVPADDLKAAALLLGMTQFRSALNRDNAAFADDLQVLKNLVAKDVDGAAGNAALLDALDRLAPRAEEGVLTPGGLTNEFRTLAGEAVVESLKGQDVSLQDKVSARFSDLFQVEKEGELVNGTPTQAALSKAEKLLEGGDISSAIATVETLEGPAAEVAAPWLDDARATLLAQSLKGFLDQLFLCRF